MYEYNAVVKSAYDGDTVTLDVDLGLDTIRTIKTRLLGIDTPELKTGTAETKAAGHSAADYMQKYVGTEVRVKTVLDKTEKYGRFLATIWPLISGPSSPSAAPRAESINDEMIRLGYAKAYFGGKK